MFRLLVQFEQSSCSSEYGAHLYTVMVRIQDWFEYKTQWRIWEITKKICNYKTHPNRRRISIITLIDPPQKVGPLLTPFFVKRKSLATHCTCSTTGTAGDSLRFNFVCASRFLAYQISSLACKSKFLTAATSQKNTTRLSFISTCYSQSQF